MPNGVFVVTNQYGNVAGRFKTEEQARAYAAVLERQDEEHDNDRFTTDLNLIEIIPPGDGAK